MKRRGLRIALVLVVVFVAAGIVLWRMTYLAPAWYAPPDGHDPQVAALADKVENRLLEEAQKIREPAAPWAVRIREAQINAWLASRLPQWIEHEQNGHWPEQLGTPQVRISPDRISLAMPMRARAESAPRPVVVDLTPQIIEGQLKLGISRIALGRISLPGAPRARLVQMMKSAAPAMADNERIREAMEIFEGQRTVDPVTRLTDHRRLRLLAIQLGDGWIDLTAQTLEPGEMSAARATDR